MAAAVGVLAEHRERLRRVLAQRWGAMPLTSMPEHLGDWRAIASTLKPFLQKFPDVVRLAGSQNAAWAVLVDPLFLPVVKESVDRTRAHNPRLRTTAELKSYVLSKCKLDVIASLTGRRDAAELLRDAGVRMDEAGAFLDGVLQPPAAHQASQKPKQSAQEIKASVEKKLREIFSREPEGVLLTSLLNLLPQGWRQLAPSIQGLLKMFPQTVQVTRRNQREWAVLAPSELLAVVRTKLNSYFGEWRLTNCSLAYLLDALAEDEDVNLGVLATHARCGSVLDMLRKIGFIVQVGKTEELTMIHKPASSVFQAASSSAPIQPPAPEDDETWVPTIVKDVEHCKEIVGILEKDHPIAIDLEGTLGGNVRVSLVQIGANSGRCYLFDLLEGGEELLTSGGLARLLEDSNVHKVGHDLRADAAALYQQFNIVLNNVFDTQVGHAYLEPSQPQVALNAVLRCYVGAENDLKPLIKSAYRHNTEFWMQRPLTTTMIDYATDDVCYLLDAYEEIAYRLKEQELYADVLLESRARIDRARFSAISLPPLQLDAELEQAEGEWEVCSKCEVTEGAEDLDIILDALPERYSQLLRKSEERLDQLIEIVMDLGRPLRARFASADGVTRSSQIGDDEVTPEDLETFCKSITNFDNENRAGISKTLHRISRLQNRAGKIVGLTIRVGKTILGLVKMISDILKEAGARKSSILLLGAPGMGKTSVIREMARVLADDEGKSVMIVDTSNEIAGDGDVPHPAIGSARRMQVPSAEMQHKRMIEAVQNHTPDVIIVDEIGTRDESAACCTIARRGVMLIATAHGVTLKDVIDNPSLNSVLGGIESVILGDRSMQERQVKQKIVREAKGPSAFEIAIELKSRSEWIVHRKVRENVNCILEEKPVPVEERKRLEDGRVVAKRKYIDATASEPPSGTGAHRGLTTA